MSKLLEKIRSRGYWLVVIRPVRFVEKRIPDISLLYPILQKTYVRLRGWDFPHLEPPNATHIDMDWIGQELEWQHLLSSWQFYQSGQFIHISGIPIDWRDQSSFWPADGEWKPGVLLGIGETIYRFTEICEFAARLSLSEAGDELMHIDIIADNLKGRVLYVDNQRRWPFDFPYRASIEKYPHSIELSRSDLVARPKDIALQAVNEFFKRFGWNTTIDMLRDWLQEMMR